MAAVIEATDATFVGSDCAAAWAMPSPTPSSSWLCGT